MVIAKRRRSTCSQRYQPLARPPSAPKNPHEDERELELKSALKAAFSDDTKCGTPINAIVNMKPIEVKQSPKKVEEAMPVLTQGKLYG